MSTAVSAITDRVRERVRAERLDLRRDPEGAERLIREELRRYAERSLSGILPRIPDEAAAFGQVLAGLTGYGPLQPYFDDPTVEEIWINRPDGSVAIVDVGSRGAVEIRSSVT
ncbi:hypothetical protein OVN18_09455 [Microcella daejeonensis]|uniref:Pilus assembly protein CpaF n=1 Tax=Microcella daejeonensis TaxID=2994971 RepID=A0A9E8ML64_9MICO|nr:hypothetical protein [Microcella daejeonensis]WAB80791.1 hypothetical protein OVN18_09455 [Microcella daejeonensis]